MVRLRTVPTNTRGNHSMRAPAGQHKPVQTTPYLRIMQAVVPAKHLCACHLNLDSSHYRGLPVVSFAFWATLLIGFLDPSQTTARAL